MKTSLPYPLYTRAERLKLLLDTLVSAVYMVDA